MSNSQDYKSLNGRITAESYEEFSKFCDLHGVTMTSMVQAMCQNSDLIKNEVIEDAIHIGNARRKR